MSLRYDRLEAKNWPALDVEIERFLADREIEAIEAVSMGAGETGNPALRVFYWVS